MICADANGPGDVVKQAHELLNLLKQEKIPKKLRVENIVTYDVPWSEQGKYQTNHFFRDAVGS